MPVGFFVGLFTGLALYRQTEAAWNRLADAYDTGRARLVSLLR